MQFFFRVAWEHFWFKFVLFVWKWNRNWKLIVSLKFFGSLHLFGILWGFESIFLWKLGKFGSRYSQIRVLTVHWMPERYADVLISGYLARPEKCSYLDVLEANLPKKNVDTSDDSQGEQKGSKKRIRFFKDPLKFR